MKCVRSHLHRWLPRLRLRQAAAVSGQHRLRSHSPRPRQPAVGVKRSGRTRKNKPQRGVNGSLLQAAVASEAALAAMPPPAPANQVSFVSGWKPAAGCRCGCQTPAMAGHFYAQQPSGFDKSAALHGAELESLLTPGEEASRVDSFTNPAEDNVQPSPRNVSRQLHASWSMFAMPGWSPSDTCCVCDCTIHTSVAYARRSGNPYLSSAACATDMGDPSGGHMLLPPLPPLPPPPAPVPWALPPSSPCWKDSADRALDTAAPSACRCCRNCCRPESAASSLRVDVSPCCGAGSCNGCCCCCWW